MSLQPFVTPATGDAPGERIPCFFASEGSGIGALSNRASLFLVRGPFSPGGFQELDELGEAMQAEGTPDLLEIGAPSGASEPTSGIPSAEQEDPPELRGPHYPREGAPGGAAAETMPPERSEASPGNLFPSLEGPH